MAESYPHPKYVLSGVCSIEITGDCWALSDEWALLGVLQVNNLNSSKASDGSSIKYKDAREQNNKKQEDKKIKITKDSVMKGGK